MLRNLVPFVQFKKREKHPWRSVNFSKVAGSSDALQLAVSYCCKALNLRDFAGVLDTFLLISRRQIKYGNENKIPRYYGKVSLAVYKKL